MMEENRKIVIQKTGVSFREATEIVAADIPLPAADEVVIRNHFAGVNGVYDQMMCFDRINHTKLETPANSGVEACGIVTAVGSEVVGIEVGMPVASVVVGNGYCHYQCCKAEEAVRIPAATAEVLALIPSGVSALLALERVGEMASGETVCISAAAGGLGNIMVQLAVNAGNEVIAICGSDEKSELLKKIGVERVIQYKKESVREVIERDYKDKLDLVMESVGGELFDTLLDNLAPFGRLVVCGFTSDRLPTQSVNQERIYTKLYWKAASVRGYMNYRFSEFAGDARHRLLSMLAAGEISPLIDSGDFRGLGSVADAVERLLAGDNSGKVIVDLRQIAT